MAHLAVVAPPTRDSQIVFKIRKWPLAFRALTPVHSCTPSLPHSQLMSIALPFPPSTAEKPTRTTQRNRQRRDAGAASGRLALVPSFYAPRCTRPTTCCYARVCT